MEFANFTFIMTEECNFRCSYCRQKKEKKSIDVPTIEKAVDFFFPFFKPECYVNFYGGEPLLVFEQVKQVIHAIQEKNNGNRKIHYTISTNGSLIDDEVLQFLKRNKFSLLLSFDGLVQDISRKKGSFQQIVSTIEKLKKNPIVSLVTNSVFTPDTVEHISKSIQFIIEMGVPNIRLSLSTYPSWESQSLLRLKKELASLRKFSLELYKETNSIPLNYLKRKARKGLFRCAAGWDRMTLTPDGKLWGCHILPNYFNEKEETKEYLKYCFGDLDYFIKEYGQVYPEVLANYSNLQMEYFYTSDSWCLVCEDLEQCSVCPFDAAYATSIIGRIPSWICQIRKIFHRERELFWDELEN